MSNIKNIIENSLIFGDSKISGTITLENGN